MVVILQLQGFFFVSVWADTLWGWGICTLCCLWPENVILYFIFSFPSLKTEKSFWFLFGKWRNRRKGSRHTVRTYFCCMTALHNKACCLVACPPGKPLGKNNKDGGKKPAGSISLVLHHSLIWLYGWRQANTFCDSVKQTGISKGS